MSDEPIKQAIDALNDAFQRDPIAMQELCKLRVFCNGKMADHPTVQVGDANNPAHESNIIVGEKDDFTLGPLGLLNGALEPITGKRIATKWSANRTILEGFCIYVPPEKDQPKLL